VTRKVSEESVSWRYVRNYVVKKQAMDGVVSPSIPALNCRDRAIVKDMILGLRLAAAWAGLRFGPVPPM